MTDGVCDVYVYIYDLSQGLAKTMSSMMLGKQIDGIWHTAIIAWNTEYFFGSDGINFCSPGTTILGQTMKKQFLGKSKHTQAEFFLHLEYLSRGAFRGENYHLLDHNCNNFSSELAQWLTGCDIPSYITGLPQEILTTPMGSFIRDMLGGQRVSGSNLGHQVHEGFLQHSNINAKENEKDKDVDTCGFGLSQIPLKFCQYCEEDITEKLSNHLYLELLEFCNFPADVEPEWGIGLAHMTLLDDVAVSNSNFSNGQQKSIIIALARAAQRQSLFRLDRSCRLNNLCKRITEASFIADDLLISVAGLLCNCLCYSSREKTIDFQVESVVALTLNLFDKFKDDKKYLDVVSGLAHNLAASSVVSFDQHLELGSCLIEFFLSTKKLEIEDHVRHLLAALRCSMHACPLLLELATSQNLNLTSFIDFEEDAAIIQAHLMSFAT